ncbi:unnamed protein product [Urochloa humidicola]
MMYSPFIRLQVEDGFLENIEVPEVQCISRMHMDFCIHIPMAALQVVYPK